MIKVVSYRDPAPEGFTIINTTSRSESWGIRLSPFLLGPVDMGNGLISQNLENAWQYSKVYPEHLDTQGILLPNYDKWMQQGLRRSRADRYPMGKDIKPVFSCLHGERMDYITARKKIYIPLYAKTVSKTFAYKTLKILNLRRKNIALRDFDGYDYHKLGISLSDVMNNPNKKMGHAFVLAMLLEGVVEIVDNQVIIHE